MKKQQGFTSAELIACIFWLIIVAGAAFGWIMNIAKMFVALNDPITGIFIARTVGIFFAPLGAILGYM